MNGAYRNKWIDYCRRHQCLHYFKQCNDKLFIAYICMTNMYIISHATIEKNCASWITRAIINGQNIYSNPA